MPVKRAYFNFYESFYRAASECGLSDAERLAFYDAMCAWAFDGAEPELEGAAKVAFTLARPNIEASPGLRGNRGGRPRRDGGDPPETPSAADAETQSETPSETQSETGFETQSKTYAKTGFETPSETSPSMKGKGRGNRKKGSSPKELPPSPPPPGAAPGAAAPPGTCPRCGSMLMADGDRARCPGCTAVFDRGEGR